MNATKPTPLGDLPADWQVKAVRELASPARNSIVGGPFGSDLVSKDYVPAGVPVIRGQNMAAQWLSGNFAFVSEEKANTLSANLAFPGDVIFTQRGTLGQVSLVPAKPFKRYLISQSQMKLAPNDSTDALFLYYVFTSEKWQRKFDQDTIQTGVPHINLGILKNIEVPIPPLSEQRAIADALGDIDAWIGAQEALIAKKRDLKTATMAQLLTGQIRLAGFDGDWQTKTLGEISDMHSGGTPPSSDSSCYGGEIPWVSIADMTSNKRDIYKTERNLSEKGLANSSAKLFPAGTILYAMYASIGECSIAAVELCSSQAILGIRPKSALDGLFLYYLLTSLKDEVKNMGQQGTQSNLNMGMVKGFEIKLPPLPEQIAIAGILSGLDEELAALDAQLDKTRQLKAATMTALLSGEKRLV